MAYIIGPKGLNALSQSDDLKFDKKDCILSRQSAETNSGGGGAAREITKGLHQVMLVDSALLMRL